ncbi:hypothetical protein BH18ACT12_BH18ACT12_21530 [soil metagenome]
MTMNEGQALPPITGEYPEGDAEPARSMPAHEGFDQAWDNAVKKAAEQWHRKGDPPVQIEVSVDYVARIDIENPGSIGQYKVIIKPAGG